MEIDSEYGQEFCEMRVGILPEYGGFPIADFGTGTPLPSLPERNLDDGLCRLFVSLDDISDEELISLYHLLLMKDRAIRQGLPYNMTIHYPLQRQ